MAVKSKDSRFDGRFFTAVKTTGIYCRPICPARTPKFENVVFYRCAAAAEEAGFRPCLRCRPETSPGTPAWSGTSSTVSRGMRLIAEGVLDDEGVEGLAARLGVGARHLRRLFTEHLGAPPLAVAQTRRLHFARQLVLETVLPIAEVAYASGYSSLRRFNDAFRKAYGLSPREMRQGKRKRELEKNGAILTLRLAYRPPYDWDSLMAFLRMRAIPGVEQCGEEVYRRTVSVGGAEGIVEVEIARAKNCLLLRVPAKLSRGIAEIGERAKRLFDLGADPQTIAASFEGDALLSGLAKRWPGLRVPGAWDGFEVVTRAVLGQQVSVKGATTLSGRVVEAYGKPLAEGGRDGLTHLFPLAATLAESNIAHVGLPKARARAIQGLARAVRDGALSLGTAESLESAVEALESLTGFGPWTAHYAAMRALGEPDAFPSGDLALRRAVAVDGGEIKEKDLLERAEAWRPWRAYAAMHLWKAYAAR